MKRTKTTAAGIRKAEKLQQENLRLREAVQRRSTELEEKKRALEIEAALEKVRAVALGMRSREDMLRICTVIAQQLAKLGLSAIRNVQTAIFYPEKESYMNYEYYARHRKTFITDTIYNNHRIAKAFAQKMLRGKGQVSITHLRGRQKVKEWLAYQKTTNVFIDTELNKADSLSYYWHSLGPVALGISTYVPLTKDELELFGKFLRVFELSYRRYLDIEKAESQAREARVEASLERIRAAAMAMRDSAALGGIIYKLYTELTRLDARLDRAFIMIVNPENQGITWWMAGYEGLLAENGFFVPFNQHPTHLLYLDHCKKRKKKWTYLFEGKEKRDWDRFGFSKTELAKLPEPIKKFMAAAKRVYLSGSSDQFGSLVTGSFEPLPQEQQDIISRFAVVFNQAYTRFLDLQKAEAQAREAEIQLALERVRARSLAMHHTSELQEVINIVAQQLLSMDIDMNGGVFMTINAEVKKDLPIWAAAGAANYAEKAVVPYLDNPIVTSILDAVKKGPGFVELSYPDEIKIAFFRHLFRYPPWKGTSATWKKELLSRKGGYTRSVAVSRYTSIGMTNHHGRRFTEAENEILHRFGNVLEQSYTRFLDLQKAEAQAREAQIEAGLERVRSRTMIMQQSRELNEAAELLYQELGKLQIPIFTCGYVLVDEKKDTGSCYMANPEGSFTFEPFRISQTGNSVFRSIYQSWKNKEEYYTVTLEGEANIAHNRYLAEESDNFPMPVDLLLSILPPVTVSNSFNFNSGYLLVVSLAPYTREQTEVLVRFAKVFEQTYTRFLDLQKAEAQAREAQIEAALEKIRSRSLAMHKSDELREVIALVFEKLKGLDFNMESRAAIITIFSEGTKEFTEWIADPGQTYPSSFLIPDIPFAALDHVWTARKNNAAFSSRVIYKEEKNNFFSYLFEHTGYKNLPAAIKKSMLDTEFYTYSIALGKNSGISIPDLSGKFLSEAETEILKRFAKVFDQAYTRFLDLQKAEAQAREAQIEAGLERVRSRTMAMHKSDELKEVIQVVLSQFIQLHINVGHAGFYIDYKVNEDMHIWLADPNIEPFYAIIPYFDSPTWKSFQYAKATGKSLYTDLLDFDEKNRFYHSLFRLFSVPEEAKKFYLECKGLAISTVLLDNVGLYIENFDAVPYTGEENRILLRFGKVFEQAYTRFLDLQKAEAQAREAEIELALERVRAKTMAMHSSQDVETAVFTLFDELLRLGIDKTLRCGIGVLQDRDHLELWTATSGDGNGVRLYKGNLNMDIHPMLQGVREAWENKESTYKYVLEGADLVNYYTAINDAPDYEFRIDISQLPPKLVHSDFFFPEGTLFTFTLEPIAESDQRIFKRFAAVFGQTYRRFLDLQQSEAYAEQAKEDLIKLQQEKKRAEEALTNLQSAQKQLVQAEKMASLGELTAGIAHEIQNPLNFVNNFSEVSRELIDELKNQKSKLSGEEQDEILKDIDSNLEKIHHHGKRADSIVKSMLQHSRSSSGKMEPTDLNALCDEYVRLAYHGLRAKDKSFNAKFETSFDPAVGKINVVQQDIGRVLLNLINNAFQALTPRPPEGGASVSETGNVPAVWIATNRLEDKVLISVRDNGPGIPSEILDKIFQPFFTTKPTGQGTGLGLSMSYDIVKAHGGEIKLETKEGEGTEFTIQLPI